MIRYDTLEATQVTVRNVRKTQTWQNISHVVNFSLELGEGQIIEAMLMILSNIRKDSSLILIGSTFHFGFGANIMSRFDFLDYHLIKCLKECMQTKVVFIYLT